MALAARVDALIRLADGRVEVRYTIGPPPLSLTWQGLSDVFPSMAALREDVDTLIATIEPRLHLLALADALSLDRTGGATFEAAAVTRGASTTDGVVTVTRTR